MGGGRGLEQDRKRMDVRVVKGGQSAEYRMYLRMVSYLVLFCFKGCGLFLFWVVIYRGPGYDGKLRCV